MVSVRAGPCLADHRRVSPAANGFIITPYRQTGRQTGRQADRQTDRQTDRQANRQTGRQADRQTGRQADRQTGRQADRQTDYRAGRQTIISDDIIWELVRIFTSLSLAAKTWCS